MQSLQTSRFPIKTEQKPCPRSLQYFRLFFLKELAIDTNFVPLKGHFVSFAERPESYTISECSQCGVSPVRWVSVASAAVLTRFRSPAAIALLSLQRLDPRAVSKCPKSVV